MRHSHCTCHFLFFQPGRTTAAPLLQQWRPVPGQRRGLSGHHALSPRPARALPAAGGAHVTSSGGPGHAHLPAKRWRAGAATVQRGGWEWRGREERGGTGAPYRLKMEGRVREKGKVGEPARKAGWLPEKKDEDERGGVMHRTHFSRN